MRMPKNLIALVYDGVHNSVFDSQVLQPLRAYHATNPATKITLISFEQQRTITPKLPNSFDYICLKRYPFVGIKSLWFAQQQLRSVLQQFDDYAIIARGPFAGYLAVHAATVSHCRHITIQVRGLVAAEFEYMTHQTTNIIQKCIKSVRKKLFDALETTTYQLSSVSPIPITYEVVSLALKKYLITQYQTDPHRIIIAQQDIPQKIDTTTLRSWRTHTRTSLNIPQDAVVYCYNGSLKPWQCPHETIAFFKQQLDTPQKNFLLVLTQDCAEFMHLLQTAHIPPETYKVMSVTHQDIYRYLAAADIGIMLRESHIINWISRPTKILEYQAVGLSIVHNNTIALLAT